MRDEGMMMTMMGLGGGEGNDASFNRLLISKGTKSSLAAEPTWACIAYERVIASRPYHPVVQIGEGSYSERVNSLRRRRQSTIEFEYYNMYYLSCAFSRG